MLLDELSRALLWIEAFLDTLLYLTFVTRRQLGSFQPRISSNGHQYLRKLGDEVLSVIEAPLTTNYQPSPRYGLVSTNGHQCLPKAEKKTTDDTDLKRARSLLARRHPRGFTFYLADPISSVQG